MPLGNGGGVQRIVRWLEPRSSTCSDPTALGAVHMPSTSRIERAKDYEKTDNFLLPKRPSTKVENGLQDFAFWGCGLAAGVILPSFSLAPLLFPPSLPSPPLLHFPSLPQSSPSNTAKPQPQMHLGCIYSPKTHDVHFRLNNNMKIEVHMNVLTT